jgi:hypothetical protein
MPGVPGAPLGPTVTDRAPRWILIASAVVVLALVAGGVFVVLRGGKHYPKEWDARVDPITKWVAKARKLDYEHPVKVNFLTPAEYSKRATEGGDGTDTETKQYYADQVAQLPTTRSPTAAPSPTTTRTSRRSSSGAPS